MSIAHQDYETKEITHEYKGAVLTEREENYHDDSDGYAIVWDEGTQSLKRVGTWTTRCHSLTNSFVDATDEVKQKASEWMKQWLEPKVKRALELEAESVKVGKRCVVIAGRKYPHGLKGTCVWKGYNKFKSTRYITFYRVGLMLENGEKIFLAEENVKAITFPVEDSTVQQKTERLKTQYHLPFVKGGLYVL